MLPVTLIDQVVYTMCYQAVQVAVKLTSDLQPVTEFMTKLS